MENAAANSVIKNGKIPGKTVRSSLVIITGLSGAGKSSAMRFLEDQGYFCVDNLPPSLILTFLSLHEQSENLGANVAIVSDVRSGALFDDFAEMAKSCDSSGIDYEILYLDCGTEKLITRFNEVRRNHPLQGKGSMKDAIEEERGRLMPIMNNSTLLIDTTDLTVSGLRKELVKKLFGNDAGNIVTYDFVSFGFKYGIPRNADFLFDVRFLPNPFYIPELGSKTGRDKEVYKYVMSCDNADDFFNKTADLLKSLLNSYISMGRTTVTIGLGCTGGQHRSVAFAVRLYEYFLNKGVKSQIRHRDISKLAFRDADKLD